MLKDMQRMTSVWQSIIFTGSPMSRFQMRTCRKGRGRPGISTPGDAQNPSCNLHVCFRHLDISCFVQNHPLITYRATSPPARAALTKIVLMMGCKTLAQGKASSAGGMGRGLFDARTLPWPHAGDSHPCHQQGKPW